jgi:hypothetical protein
VILLENLNEWNLFPAKRRIIGEKKEWSKDLKAKEVKPHMKSSRLKKGRMKFTSCWERFYQKKERRSYFSIVKNSMCGLIHTHTSFAFALPSIP